MKSSLIMPATLVAAVAATGCNTVQGIGKDIERGGEALQKMAK